MKKANRQLKSEDREAIALLLAFTAFDGKLNSKQKAYLQKMCRRYPAIQPVVNDLPGELHQYYSAPNDFNKIWEKVTVKKDAKKRRQ